MKFLEFDQNVSKLHNFLNFRQDSLDPILDPFRRFTKMRKVIGSRLKRKANVRVFK